MVADLEGMSSISRWEICFPAHAEYSEALAAYRAEVDAVAEAARAWGLGAVRILDWHQRLLPLDLFPEVMTPDELLLEQRPRVAVLLGFHARAGQPDAFGSRTLIPGLQLFWEDREAGELGLASRWLGELGIPLLLVTGDRGLTSEAEEWTDQTATVTVKRALAPDRAESLPLERAHRAIADALQRVLARRSWWWVYRPSSPIQVRLELPDGSRSFCKASSMQELFELLFQMVGSFGRFGLPLVNQRR